MKRQSPNRKESAAGEDHLRKVRRICNTLPETTEKLSRGEPTFFVRKKVYAMFANNHHNDGHVAVGIPVAPGLQAALIKTEPDKFFMPPYVGVRGWVGIELDRVGDEELAPLLAEAWQLIAPKTLRASQDPRYCNRGARVRSFQNTSPNFLSLCDSPARRVTSNLPCRLPPQYRT